MVEFALILPVFLLLILATVDFGWALRTYIIEQNAAREGARYWALNGTASCTTIGTQVTDKAPTLSGLTLTYYINDASTTTCSATTTNAVKVSASYDYTYITPLGTFFNYVTRGTIPSPLTLSSSATMRVE